MKTKFIKIVLLSAVSDGEIQPAELAMLNQIRMSHPAMKHISDEEFQTALADIYNKFAAGMETAQILEQLGKQFNEEEKHSAYALGMEVCAADYAVLDAEKDFLDLLEKKWSIPKSIKTAVKKSIQLRYSIPMMDG